MKNIIAQQLVKMQGEILKKIQENGLENIGQTAEDIFQTLKEWACALLGVILEATDAEIAKATKERKQDGLKVKERNVIRQLVTSLGVLQYRRGVLFTAHHFLEAACRY